MSELPPKPPLPGVTAAEAAELLQRAARAGGAIVRSTYDEEEFVMGQMPYDRAEVVEDNSLTAVDALDMQLDRFEKTLGVLRQRLAPVLSNEHMNLVEALARVRPESASALRSRADRLVELNSELDAIIASLDI